MSDQNNEKGNGKDLKEYWVEEKPHESEIKKTNKINNNILYEIVNEQYLYELDRKRHLDDKANSIIEFVGIILGLQAGLGSFLLKDVSRENGVYTFLSSIFLGGIVFLTLSIICGLIAFRTRKLDIAPEVDSWLPDFSGANTSDIFSSLICIKSIAIKNNSKKNDFKVRYINLGFAFLILGILVNILFIYGLLVI